MHDYLSLICSKHCDLAKISNNVENLISEVNKRPDVLVEIIPLFYSHGIFKTAQYIDFFCNAVYKNWDLYNFKNKTHIINSALDFLEDTGNYELNAKLEGLFLFIIKKENYTVWKNVVEESILCTEYEMKLYSSIKFYNILVLNESTQNIFSVKRLKILGSLFKNFIKATEVNDRLYVGMFKDFIYNCINIDYSKFHELNDLKFVHGFFSSFYWIFKLNIEDKKIMNFECFGTSTLNIYLLDIKIVLFKLTSWINKSVHIKEGNIQNQNDVILSKKINVYQKKLDLRLLKDLRKITRVHVKDLTNVWEEFSIIRKYISTISVYLNSFIENNKINYDFFSKYLEFFVFDLLVPILSQSKRRLSILKNEQIEVFLFDYIPEMTKDVLGFLNIVREVTKDYWRKNNKSLYINITKRLVFFLDDYKNNQGFRSFSKAHGAIIMLLEMNTPEIDYNYDKLFEKHFCYLIKSQRFFADFLTLLVMSRFKTTSLSKKTSIQLFEAYLSLLKTTDPILFECTINATSFFNHNSHIYDKFKDHFYFILYKIGDAHKCLQEYSFLDLKKISGLLINLNEEDILEKLGLLAKDLYCFIYDNLRKKTKQYTDDYEDQYFFEDTKDLSVFYNMEYDLRYHSALLYLKFIRITCLMYGSKRKKEIEKKYKNMSQTINDDKNFSGNFKEFFQKPYTDIEIENTNYIFYRSITSFYNKIFQKLYLLIKIVLFAKITDFYEIMLKILIEIFHYSDGIDQDKFRFVEYILTVSSEDSKNIDKNMWPILDNAIHRMTPKQFKTFKGKFTDFIMIMSKKSLKYLEDLNNHVLYSHMIVSLSLNFPSYIKKNQDIMLNFVSSYLLRDKNAINKTFFIELFISVVILKLPNDIENLYTYDFIFKLLKSILKNQDNKNSNIDRKLLLVFISVFMCDFEPDEKKYRPVYIPHMPLLYDSHYKNVRFVKFIEKTPDTFNICSSVLDVMGCTVEELGAILIKELIKIWKEKKNHDMKNPYSKLNEDVYYGISSKPKNIINIESFMRHVLKNLNSFGRRVLASLSIDEQIMVSKYFRIDQF